MCLVGLVVVRFVVDVVVVVVVVAAVVVAVAVVEVVVAVVVVVVEGWLQLVVGVGRFGVQYPCGW